MKSASKVFYTVGFVFNVIGLIFSVLFVIALALSMNNPEILQKIAQESGRGVEFVKQTLSLMIIVFSASIFFDTLILVLTIIANKSLKEGNGKMSTHIILLIAGFLGVNLFYLLGGVFGVVAANEDTQE